LIPLEEDRGYLVDHGPFSTTAAAGVKGSNRQGLRRGDPTEAVLQPALLVDVFCALGYSIQYIGAYQNP
jgi:hypothetical protein